MRVLKGQVSDPPPGPFDATSTDILWLNDNGDQAALIPSSRFQDFLAGEERRGLTQYYHRDRNVSETTNVRTFRLCTCIINAMHVRCNAPTAQLFKPEDGKSELPKIRFSRLLAGPFWKLSIIS